MFGPAGMLQPLDSELCISSHWAPFPDQALFLCDYIYTSDLGINFFVLSRPVCSDSDLSFLQQSLSLRALGRDGGIANIYGRDC